MSNTHAYPGLFLVFEGCDGSGKTTNAKVMAELFKAEGIEVVLTREPGGTPLAETIRNVALQNAGGDEPTHGLTELLLMGASRAQHLAEKIIPALQAGKVVICDRFYLSSRAYQGHGRGLLQAVHLMEKIIHPTIYPDYVVYFNLPFATSLERTQARNQVTGYGDRFDNAELEFKKHVYAGYVAECLAGEEQPDDGQRKLNPQEVIYVDATLSLDVIHDGLKQMVNKLIGAHGLKSSPIDLGFQGWLNPK
jgi:dTMP kinase